MVFPTGNSGFPKSMNDGPRGTALKPAHEPVMLARKPLDGTCAANHAKHGTGYLQIDDARVPLDGDSYRRVNVTLDSPGYGKGWHEPVGEVRESHEKGRWPANLCHDGSAEVLAEFPHTATSEIHMRFVMGRDSTFARVGPARLKPTPANQGSAARFFYCAKPARAEREAGLAGLSPVAMHEVQGRREGSAGSGNPRAGVRGAARVNAHPTVKPIELMRWLVRLACPPDGVVLDPFLGSGTTAIAAHLEGRRCIGIERDADFARIAEARLAWWRRHAVPGRSVEQVLGDGPRARERDAAQLSLLDNPGDAVP